MEYLANLYFNQPIIILDTSASVGLTTGSLITYGGASISGDTYVGGKTVLQGGLTASSLNVTGNLFVGGPVMKIPTGNIASRPLSPAAGYVRYNTETQQFEGYGPGDAWGSLGGVIDIAQTTKILASGSPSTTDGNLYFYTVNGERMRINSAGNIGIGTSAPSYLLDVNGTGAFINVTAQNLWVSGNSTIANLAVTDLLVATFSVTDAELTTSTISSLLVSNGNIFNQTSANLLNTNMTSTNALLTNILNTNITSTNAIITNIASTNETNTNLLNTNLTSTNAVLTNILNTNITSTNAIVTNITSTNETNSNLLNTNFTSSNAVVSHLLNTNMTGTNILVSNVTAGTINASFGNYATVTSSLVASTTISAGSIYLSGDINVAGTLTVVNITATNIVDTNVSAGVVLASTLLAGVGNSNTLGSIYTTGGNVGIGSTAPTATLDVNGTAVFSTSVSSASIFGGNSTMTNLVATNLTASTLSLTNGAVTNATITNLLNTNISSSQGIITSLVTTNETNSNLLNTNMTSTNAVVSHLLNTNITSTNAIITNIASTNETNSNLLNTNITSTNAVVSHLLNTNITSTNAIITNVVSTNETNSNLLNTNMTSTNAVVSHLLNTNITSTNAIITNVVSTNETNSNLLNTNITSSNAIITNISSTNETNSNLLNTNFTSTNAVVSHLLNTNVSSTNAIITNVVSTNSSIGTINITGTDNSSSVTEGGVLIVAGGARVAKNLFVGGPAFQIPKGDTASRPVLPEQGYVRYNTEYSQFEGFGAGNAWGSLGGVSDIAQTTKILASASPGVTDGNLYFYNVGSENMRLNSAGNLGLGTTAPGYKLDVVGTFSASIGATLGSLNVTGGTIINTVDVTPNLGDISKERSFSLANGSSGAISGFAFNGSIVRGFQAIATVQIVCSNGENLYANFDLRGVQLKNSMWIMTSVFVGDHTGVDFTMNTSGQVLYTSTSIGNYTSSNVKFRALTTNV